MSKYNWMDEGACLGSQDVLELPFGDERPAAEAKAKALCATCPVQADCLKWALRWKDGFPNLVIAGYTHEELKARRGELERELAEMLKDV